MALGSYTPKQRMEAIAAGAQLDREGVRFGLNNKNAKGREEAMAKARKKVT
jgi:hypothetical protein